MGDGVKRVAAMEIDEATGQWRAPSEMVRRRG